VVNDQMREHVGKAAIGSWAAKERIGDRVTMYVTKSAAHPGGHAVIARVTGAYDKIRVPDPLELRFYFTLAGDAISQLVIIPLRRG
jgi:hypothetical protein